MFEYKLNNCAPEYYRSISEQEARGNRLAYERQLHYEPKRKKLDEAERTPK